MGNHSLFANSEGSATRLVNEIRWCVYITEEEPPYRVLFFIISPFRACYPQLELGDTTKDSTWTLVLLFKAPPSTPTTLLFIILPNCIILNKWCRTRKIVLLHKLTLYVCISVRCRYVSRRCVIINTRINPFILSVVIIYQQVDLSSCRIGILLAPNTMPNWNVIWYRMELICVSLLLQPICQIAICSFVK